jgi:AcrR family transcriptional regulator
MEADRRTRLSPADRRAQLVSVGVTALADIPLHDLGMDDLARRAGVSRGLVFHYFGSRQGLHRELIVAARDGMLRATEPVTELGPRERLHDTLARTVQFVRDHRSTFYSLVRGVSSGDDEVRAAIDEARETQAARVLAVAIELGADDAPLLRVAVRAWIALAEEALVAAARSAEADAELVGFLERSALAVADAARG